MVDITENNSILEDSENKFFNLFEEEIKSLANDTESPFAIVKGTVMSSVGTPLEGALVKLMSLIYEPKFHGTTDASGQYKITNILPGIYKVYAIYPDKILAEGDVITTAPSQEIEKNFTLEDDPDMKLGLIAGDVFDQNSKKLLEKVLIALYSSSSGGEYLVGKTTTNKYGQFTFRDVKLGIYNIIVGITGYNATSISTNVINEGQIIPIQVGLIPISNGTISGVIKDEEDNPINESDVILYKVKNDGQLTPVAVTKTNSEGVYLFQNVEKATYKIKSNQTTTVSLITPNSPSYYSFSIANTSTLNPTVISLEEEADLYQGAEYVFNKKFVKYIGGVNGGYINININALVSGYYNVSIEYLSGFLPSTLILQEDPDNDGDETTLNFPQTIGWNLNDAKSITITLPLYSGINEFKIFNTLGVFSPWIGDISLSYVKHSYTAETIDGVVGNGAIYIAPFVTNLGGASNGEVTIPIDIPFTQLYKLTIEYLSGDTDRPLKIDVDGVNEVSVIVPKTNDWTIGSTRTYDVRVEAEEGLKYFKFYNDTGETAPNVGNLTFDDYTINKVFMPKDVILLDGANIKRDISGLEYIDGVTLGKGKIQFSVNVFETQLYDFQIAYRCSDDRNCTVKLNDRIVVERKFIFNKTGDAIGIFNTNLLLNEGVNTIVIYNE